MGLHGYQKGFAHPLSSFYLAKITFNTDYKEFWPQILRIDDCCRNSVPSLLCLYISFIQTLIWGAMTVFTVSLPEIIKKYGIQ